LWRRCRRLCSWLILSGSRWLRTWWLFDNMHSNKLSCHVHVYCDNMGYSCPRISWPGGIVWRCLLFSNITISDLAIPDTYCSRDNTGYSCPPVLWQHGVLMSTCIVTWYCVTLFIIQQHYNQWLGNPRYILFSWQHGVLMSTCIVTMRGTHVHAYCDLVLCDVVWYSATLQSVTWRSPIHTVLVTTRGTRVHVYCDNTGYSCPRIVWPHGVLMSTCIVTMRGTRAHMYCDNVGYSCPQVLWQCGVLMPSSIVTWWYCVMLFGIQQHYNQWLGDPRYILFTWQHGVLVPAWYEVRLSW